LIIVWFTTHFQSESPSSPSGNDEDQQGGSTPIRSPLQPRLTRSTSTQTEPQQEQPRVRGNVEDPEVVDVRAEIKVIIQLRLDLCFNFFFYSYFYTFIIMKQITFWHILKLKLVLVQDSLIFVFYFM
jgi:hypothetical protein